MDNCKICGELNCKKHSFLLPRSFSLKEFSGSSPPEIFIGRYGYPNINVGILSPIEHGDTQIMSSAEKWHEKRLKIPEIVSMRNKLIYGKSKSCIKNPITPINSFLSTLQEVAMTHKSISAEFKLKKAIFKNKEQERRNPLIVNAAQVEKVTLQENPKIIPKVEYITSDTDAKATIGILELEKSGLQSSQIIKIFSAGLLGLRTNRKLVPTRWSITAVDSTLSEEKLKKIRYNKEISDFLVFTSDYLGNHYEFLLLPAKWSFEVIEKGVYHAGIWKDYESFFKRKKYAESVTGAYYANRLALCEYLENISRQASCLVIREILPEYNVPLGVGILRETSRAAFKQQPKKFNTLQEALKNIQQRLKQPITNYICNSNLLAEFGKQSRLEKWF